MEPHSRVLASRVLTHQVRHVTALLRRGHELVDDPPPDTPAHADLDHINKHHEKHDLLGLRWWVHRAAIHNLKAAEEHLTGVGVVLQAERLLPLPAMALARSVYEAVINTCWLVDAQVPTEQRLARWAGRLLHDGQEPTSALDSFGDSVAAQEERERVGGARSLGRDLMTRAGFDLKAKGGDKSEETARVTYSGESSSLTPNVTQLVSRFTPASNLWHMFSGAAHSRGWLVSGLEGSETEVVVSVMAPLLDTSDALAYEMSRYFGLDPRHPYGLPITRNHAAGIQLLIPRPQAAPRIHGENPGGSTSRSPPRAAPRACGLIPRPGQRCCRAAIRGRWP